MGYSKQVKMHPYGVAKLVLHSLEENFGDKQLRLMVVFQKINMTDGLYFSLYQLSMHKTAMHLICPKVDHKIEITL